MGGSGVIHNTICSFKVTARYLGGVILLIDNYDSFTYNLVQAMGALDLGRRLRVVRNDSVSVEDVEGMGPEFVVISPGPGSPKDAGISCEVIRRFAGRVPILGVCLGHQCIAEVFGMRVERNNRIMHGKTSEMNHDERTIFEGIENPFTAMRYHSLVVPRESIDEKEWEVSAWTKEGEVMGMRRRWDRAVLEGVQFHPESFATEAGAKLLANFFSFSRPDLSKDI